MVDIGELRSRIVAQADGLGAEGWMEFDVPVAVRAGGRLRVPRGAFELWAVARSNGGHLAVPWTAVSPVGVKQGADDPYHTDWMLGAGLQPGDMRPGGTNPHHEALSAAAYSARAEVERRLLGFRCSVLLQGPRVKGRVHVPNDMQDYPEGLDEDGLPPVVVVKNAGPDWLEMALRTLAMGGAVIVERGGEMAHLITEIRPSGRGPVIRVEKARKLYPHGSVLDVVPAEGVVSLVEDERLYAAAVAMAVSTREGATFPSLEDGVNADAVPPHPVPVNKPKFVITEMKSGDRDPTGDYGYMQGAAKVESAHWEVRGIFHWSDRGYDIHKGHLYLLEIVARERGEGRRPRRNFFVPARYWTDGEVMEACTEVLYTVDPDSRFAYQRYIERKRREEDEDRERARVKWMAMGDGEFIEFVKRVAADEDELDFEFQSGQVAPGEYHDNSRVYRRAFEVMEEVASAKGLDMDVDAARPALQRRLRSLEADRERDRQFEEYMRSTPPLEQAARPSKAR